MMDGAGWTMGLGGWLWMTLVLVVSAAIVVGLVWLAASGVGGRRGSPSEDALKILKARFARGDISEQEYEQARRLLEVG